MRAVPIRPLMIVLDYLQNVELQHYAEVCDSANGDVKDHVYSSALILLHWMERSYADPTREFARECLKEYEAVMRGGNPKAA